MKKPDSESGSRNTQDGNVVIREYYSSLFICSLINGAFSVIQNL
jgi:uncharacterized protein Veg